MVKAARSRERRQESAKLRDCIMSALQEYIEPQEDASGRWWSPLWHVVRSCKGHRSLRSLDGMGSWSLVRRLVPIHHFLRADSRLSSEDDVAAAWIGAWDKIRYLPGETELALELREADESPVLPPRDRGSGYARFLSLCAALARSLQADDSQIVPEIIIPIERWGLLLGVRAMTVSQWRQWAQADGVIELAQKHSYAKRTAAVYRVNLNRLPSVRGTL